VAVSAFAFSLMDERLSDCVFLLLAVAVAAAVVSIVDIVYTCHHQPLYAFTYSLTNPHAHPTAKTNTFRLWDVETGQEVLLQEGHFKETHALAFQVLYAHINTCLSIHSLAHSFLHQNARRATGRCV
jgi:hypothetical protein